MDRPHAPESRQTRGSEVDMPGGPLSARCDGFRHSERTEVLEELLSGCLLEPALRETQAFLKRVRAVLMDRREAGAIEAPQEAEDAARKEAASGARLRVE